MTRIALLAALLAGACASGSPAPIAYGSSAGGRAPPATPAQSRTPPAQQHEEPPPARAPITYAEPDWADGEGTALSSYALRPEDAQPFDPANPPRTHRVAANESLYDIATRYQAPLRALIEQNDLEPPYTLAPGRELELPPPRFHTVVSGEGFEDVARRYNVDTRSLALLNRMQPPYRVSRGDRVVLPAIARARAPASQSALQQTSAPPPAGSGRFLWPMQGDLAGRFGAQASGGRLDGIEIAGREGAAVAAAADGDVVYAGSDLEAYGTLVLIRHAENYVTAYAYNRRALVREGQRVRAGEAIAELGARADGRARLMFQVRRGSEVLDPLPLMSEAAR